MPKLLAFLPCERVVVAQEDNSVSIFSVVQGFKFKIRDGEYGESQPNQVPLRWSVLTMWHKQPEDEGKSYEQRVELLSPGGRPLVSQSTEFMMVKPYHRNMARTFGFPVTTAGTYLLRLTLKASDSSEFVTVAEFPLQLVDESVLDGSTSALSQDSKTAH